MKIKINVEDKAKVLACLYNNSKSQGMGYLHFDSKQMNENEAENLLKIYKNFDYLKGRIMNIDLSKNEVDTWLYDRDNGENAATKALSLENIEYEIISES